jgi:hypothetical protein
MHAASAAAQPAYLAPGAIYVGGGPAPIYGPGYGYGYGGGAYDAPGHDNGYGISAYEGYGDECDPGPYGAPGYDYGYGLVVLHSDFDGLYQGGGFGVH